MSCKQPQSLLSDAFRNLQDGKGGGDGFEVQKYGDGRVALIGMIARIFSSFVQSSLVIHRLC